MAERPGIMFYFDDWEPMLALDDKSLADMLRASIRYGLTGEVPDFDGINAVLWGMIAPKIVRDGERYEARKESGEYAVYCREIKKAGEEPLSFMDWKKEKDRPLSIDNDSIQQQQQSQFQQQTQQQLQPHLQQQDHFQMQCQGDSKGGEPYKPLTEAAFEERRQEMLSKLGVSW